MIVIHGPLARCDAPYRGSHAPRARTGGKAEPIRSQHNPLLHYCKRPAIGVENTLALLQPQPHGYGKRVGTAAAIKQLANGWVTK